MLGKTKLTGGDKVYRSMMQVFTKDSEQALEFYRKAFEATVLCDHRHENGTVAHAELDIFGQVFAICEIQENEVNPGNTMQFCLHLGEGKQEVLNKAYDVLKDGAKIHYPLGPCDWSKLMVGLIDKYGINWCIFE